MPQPEISINFLVMLVPVVLVLALSAPLYTLLLLDIAFVVFPGEWQISRVHFDATDVIFAGIFLGLIVRRPARRDALRWRLPHWNFLLLLGVVGSLVCFALLLLVLLLKIFPGTWQLFGSDFAFQDLLGAGIAVGVVVEALRWRFPYMTLWVALGVFVSLAYLYAPMNSVYFTSPVAVTYQLYRYCWRPLLFYPLALLLLRDRQKVDTTVIVIVLAGAACALMSFSQGYAGVEATGPFLTKNGLGSGLVMPFLLALTGLLYVERRWLWRVYALSVVVMVRGLLFAGSRGAFVAVLAGIAFVLCWLLTQSHGRSRALRFTLAALLLGDIFLGLKPDVFERPSVQHLLTASEGTEDTNLKWRIQQRWPFFWKKSLDNFWLGTGTDVDASLGDSAITPHNGYLGVAVISGFPSMLLMVTFAFLTVRGGVRSFRRRKDLWQRAIGIAIATAVVGMLVHNMVEEAFLLPFVTEIFWILTAVAITLTRQPGVLTAAATSAAPQRPRGRRTRQVGLSLIGARL